MKLKLLTSISRYFPQLARISEAERERRKRSNVLTTKINFIAWVVEVKQIVMLKFYRVVLT